MYFLLAQTVLMTSERFDFLPDEGVLPVLYLAEIPTLTPMYKCCCALCLGYDYASQKHGGLLTRILNNDLVVTACQIKDTTMHTMINTHSWTRTEQLLVFFNSHVG